MSSLKTNKLFDFQIIISKYIFQAIVTIVLPQNINNYYFHSKFMKHSQNKNKSISKKAFEIIFYLVLKNINL